MNIAIKGKEGIYKYNGKVKPQIVMLFNELALVDQEKKVNQKSTDTIAEVYEVTDNTQLTSMYFQQLDEIKKSFAEDAKEVTEAIVAEALDAIADVEKRTVDRGLVKINSTYEQAHFKINQLTNLIKNGFNVYLVGPAGSGKSTTIEKVAKTLNTNLYYNNSVQNSFDLTGFMNANGNYVETEFYNAFTKGGIFFLDEIDTAAPDALITLNSAIANKKLAFPNGTFEAHKDFKVCAAANTYGVGADRIYIGRNALDGATLDRFIMIDFDYDEKLELSLVDDAKLFYSDFLDIRRGLQKNKTLCTTRALLNSYKLYLMYDKKIITLKEFKDLTCKSLFTKGLSTNQIKNLEEVCETTILGKCFNSFLKEV